MKKLLLGCAVFAALALPANAADLAVKAPAMAAYNWGGCYIGGNAGGKWGRFSNEASTPRRPLFSYQGSDSCQ